MSSDGLGLGVKNNNWLEFIVKTIVPILLSIGIATFTSFHVVKSDVENTKERVNMLVSEVENNKISNALLEQRLNYIDSQAKETRETLKEMKGVLDSLSRKQDKVCARFNIQCQ